MKKTIRSLLCGLGAALLLLTCLPASALAADKAPSFTGMFPGYADGAKDPNAAEAVLADMGTLIGQSQTVNGVTCVCYTEADFIDYLNAHIFPDQPSALIRGLGCPFYEVPGKYRDIPRFNF